MPSLSTGRYADLRGDQRTAQILQDLHTAVEQIAQSGRIEQWLDAMATDGLRRWSANNRLLALLQLQERAQQRPELLDDVHMMSFRQWDKEHGRKVIKGERAIWILAPTDPPHRGGRRRRQQDQPDDCHRLHRGSGLQHHPDGGTRPAPVAASDRATARYRPVS